MYYLFCAGSWLSGFKAVLALPIVPGLCHLKMLQVLFKRMGLIEAAFSLMPCRVLAATPMCSGNGCLVTHLGLSVHVEPQSCLFSPRRLCSLQVEAKQ